MAKKQKPRKPEVEKKAPRSLDDVVAFFSDSFASILSGNYGRFRSWDTYRERLMADTGEIVEWVLDYNDGLSKDSEKVRSEIFDTLCECGEVPSNVEFQERVVYDDNGVRFVRSLKDPSQQDASKIVEFIYRDKRPLRTTVGLLLSCMYSKRRRDVQAARVICAEPKLSQVDFDELAQRMHEHDIGYIFRNREKFDIATINNLLDDISGYVLLEENGSQTSFPKDRVTLLGLFYELDPAVQTKAETSFFVDKNHLGLVRYLYEKGTPDTRAKLTRLLDEHASSFLGRPGMTFFHLVKYAYLQGDEQGHEQTAREIMSSFERRYPEVSGFQAVQEALRDFSFTPGHLTYECDVGLQRFYAPEDDKSIDVLVMHWKGEDGDKAAQAYFRALKQARQEEAIRKHPGKRTRGTTGRCRIDESPRHYCADSSHSYKDDGRGYLWLSRQGFPFTLLFKGNVSNTTFLEQSSDLACRILEETELASRMERVKVAQKKGLKSLEGISALSLMLWSLEHSEKYPYRTDIILDSDVLLALLITGGVDVKLVPTTEQDILGRDYFENPKPNVYRAAHTPFIRGGDYRELQVHTRLSAHEEGHQEGLASRGRYRFVAQDEVDRGFKVFVSSFGKGTRPTDLRRLEEYKDEILRMAKARYEGRAYQHIKGLQPTLSAESLESRLENATYFLLNLRSEMPESTAVRELRSAIIERVARYYKKKAEDIISEYTAKDISPAERKVKVFAAVKTVLPEIESGEKFKHLMTLLGVSEQELPQREAAEYIKRQVVRYPFEALSKKGLMAYVDRERELQGIVRFIVAGYRSELGIEQRDLSFEFDGMSKMLYQKALIDKFIEYVDIATGKKKSEEIAPERARAYATGLAWVIINFEQTLGYHIAYAGSHNIDGTKREEIFTEHATAAVRDLNARYRTDFLEYIDSIRTGEKDAVPDTIPLGMKGKIPDSLETLYGDLKSLQFKVLEKVYEHFKSDAEKGLSSYFGSLDFSTLKPFVIEKKLRRDIIPELQREGFDYATASMIGMYVGFLAEQYSISQKKEEPTR